MNPKTDDFLNLRFCARCPRCEQINEKKGTYNLINCSKCEQFFCFICNLEVDGEDHYNKVSAMCHLNTDPWTDI